MINDIFRFDEAVPSPYVINSRDMQVLLRLFTYGLNPAKYHAEQAEYINNSQLCNDRILSLLSEKVQFIDHQDIESDVLRLIITNFCGLLRGKGTLDKIEKAVYLYLLASKIHAKTMVYVEEDTSTIQIGLNCSPIDVSVLETILKYLVPTGWLTCIFFYEDLDIRMSFQYKNNICRIKEPYAYANSMYVMHKTVSSAGESVISGFVYPSMETVEIETLSADDMSKYFKAVQEEKEGVEESGIYMYSAIPHSH